MRRGKPVVRMHAMVEPISVICNLKYDARCYLSRVKRLAAHRPLPSAEREEARI